MNDRRRIVPPKYDRRSVHPFMMGIARIFGWGQVSPRKRPLTFNERVTASLRSDWTAVGNDMHRAIRRCSDSAP
jgi:hypothetical protein